MHFPIFRRPKDQPLSTLGAIAGMILSSTGAIALSLPAQADVFDNTGLQFDTDTIIEFRFEGSNGVYQSTFGVMNLTTGEKFPLFFEVSEGGSSSGASSGGTSSGGGVNEFRFRANVPYSFYLESEYLNRPAGLLYSVSARNPDNQQLMLFEGELADLASGGVLLRWDDTGALLVPPSQQDRDYNDFRVRAGGHVACPFGDSQASQDGGQGHRAGAIACANSPVIP